MSLNLKIHIVFLWNAQVVKCFLGIEALEEEITILTYNMIIIESVLVKYEKILYNRKRTGHKNHGRLSLMTVLAMGGNSGQQNINSRRMINLQDIEDLTSACSNFFDDLKKCKYSSDNISDLVAFFLITLP